MFNFCEQHIRTSRQSILDLCPEPHLWDRHAVHYGDHCLYWRQICQLLCKCESLKFFNFSFFKVFLTITLISICSIFAGFFNTVVSSQPNSLKSCLLGPQLLQRPPDGKCAKFYLDGNLEPKPTWLYTQFCNDTQILTNSSIQGMDHMVDLLVADLS